MFLDIYLGVTFAIVGLFVGSFLNVCIYRLPRGAFTSNNRSYCPQCHTTLRWYELIPLFSYIIQKGRCSTCKEKISIRYPIVELANMILWLLAYMSFGLSLQSFLSIIFFSILLVMSMIDIDIKEVPNAIILAIFAIGIISFFSNDGILWWEKLLGLVVMSVPFLIIGIITGGIGGGDIKLLFVSGLFLGWKLIILGGVFGVIIGGMTGLILLVMRRAGRKSEMPLGPSLATGFVIATLWGGQIINWYMGLLA